MVRSGSYWKWVAVLIVLAMVAFGGCVCREPIDPTVPPPPPPPPTLPAFPWPPPPASAELRLPARWLPAIELSNLAEVASRLEEALVDARYPRWSYSSVPNGFALVAQMEQIAADGTPSPGRARWSSQMPWVSNMTILEFVRALVSAQPGYYRVIVFIVTDQPWSRAGDRPTGEEAEQWLAKGLTGLTESLGREPYGPNHRTSALVYEFRKASEEGEAILVENSLTPAKDHLFKAGIAEPLSGL